MMPKKVDLIKFHETGVLLYPEGVDPYSLDLMDTLETPEGYQIFNHQIRELLKIFHISIPRSFDEDIYLSKVIEKCDYRNIKEIWAEVQAPNLINITILQIIKEEKFFTEITYSGSFTIWWMSIKSDDPVTTVTTD